MKKILFVSILVFESFTSFSQDLTSKKGEPMLPEANDWAISLNADPIFTFIGNAFHGDSASGAPGVNWTNNNYTVVGKKFIDEKTAYRVLVRVGLANEVTKKSIKDALVTTPAVYPSSPEMVEDKMSVKKTNIGIGVGKEWRRGKTRLQGFYGADVMIWMTSNSIKYKYGNSLSTGTPSISVDSATTSDFNSNLKDDGYGNKGRILTTKSGMTFGIGVRGFIGAEYFIFPKIAIGAEYGWGLGFQSSAKGKQTLESVGTGTNGPEVGQIDTFTSGSSKFGVDTDINQNTIFGFKGSNTGSSASLKVTLHF